MLTLDRVSKLLAKLQHETEGISDFLEMVDIRVFFNVTGIPCQMLLEGDDELDSSSRLETLETGDSLDGPTNLPEELELAKKYIRETPWSEIECAIADFDVSCLSKIQEEAENNLEKYKDIKELAEALLS